MHEKKVLIATHEMLYGAPQALRDYLTQNKQKELLFISLPLLDNKKYGAIYSKKGKTTTVKSFMPPTLPLSVRYVLDMIVLFCWSIFYGKIHLFVGVDPLNCIVGIVLKKLGRVKYVIFYSIDFVPKRFSNLLLNTIYHAMEKICVKNCDEAWNVSPRISDGREKFLSINKNKYNQTVVPIGIWEKSIKNINCEKINMNQLVFIGHLLEKQGVQEVLKAMPKIVKKIPKLKLLIVGGGEYGNALKKKAKELRIENNVIFSGWIREREGLYKVMSKSACALACYKPEKERLYNFTYYADPTKIKDYLSYGLPVILTDVPYNARDIAAHECGIIVKYKKEEIAHAVLSLLLDKNKLRLYRKNAREYAKKFTWEKIFNAAFEEYKAKTIR